MYSCLIVDDEAAARQLIRGYVEKFFPNYSIFGEASNVVDAVNQIDSLKPDLVFLDIDLQLGTGFDVVKRASYQHFSVVFITAFDQYAIDAFRIAAVDYLIKPLRLQDLREALGRFEEKKETAQTDKSIIKVLIGNFEQSDHENKNIVLPTLNGFEIVRVSHIIRCESERNYTTFFLSSNTQIIVSKTMKDFEQILSGFGFFRLHQSHLVNLACVKKYFRGQGGEVEMSDGAIIPVSRSKKDEFLKIFLG